MYILVAYKVANFSSYIANFLGSMSCMGGGIWNLLIGVLLDRRVEWSIVIQPKYMFVCEIAKILGSRLELTSVGKIPAITQIYMLSSSLSPPRYFERQFDLRIDNISEN